MSKTPHETRHDAISWIEANVKPRTTNSAEALYDGMESQSGRCLPVVYVPFEGNRHWHFVDRGQILDFHTSVGDDRILDFGPGDGWPSLMLAPMVDEVVGVDGSVKRVEVCTDNARRLGVSNAAFVHVPPGEPLPFDDESFDGVAAASSLEQTPDPKAALAELFRVLKPGGRLRMHYESLGYYRGGKEREVDVVGWQPVILVVDRHVEQEYVRQFRLLYDLPPDELRRIVAKDGDVSYDDLTPHILESLSGHLVEAATWVTNHPSCRTWLAWLEEAGFSSALPTYDGGWFARRLFHRMPESDRPTDIERVDAFLRPLVDVVATMEAPPVAQPREWEPWITATK